MENKDILDLLEKYDLGTCSAEEKLLVDQWYNSFAERHAGAPIQEDLDEEIKLIWDNIQANKGQRNVVRLKYKTYAIAATIAFTLIGAGLFYFNSQQPVDQRMPHQTASGDMDPGRSGATLTLASGKKVRLTELASGEITKEAGVAISKSADGQLVYEVLNAALDKDKTNTLSTANGETYRLKLPDGSLVWLNAASALTYTTNLQDEGYRKVKLVGEAYFQVAKDKVHPFIVESQGQEVEVLGTHFNVNAYADEPAIATTLLEGAVVVTVGGLKKILKPGEEALNRKGSVKVSPANVEKVTDWKSGEFYVNHIDFKTAMRKIARWYDVEVIYNSSVPDDMEIGGWISRNEKLSSVLKSIESAGLVHFKIDGRKIYVSK